MRIGIMTGKLVAALAVGVALALAAPGAAEAASKVTNQQSDRFEWSLSSCSGSAGAALYGCVSGALQQLSSGLSYSDIQQVAPGALPAVTRAAQDMAGAKSKAQASSALNRVQSTIRQLAARASGEAAQVYGRLGAAMARAQAVIAAGG